MLRFHLFVLQILFATGLFAQSPPNFFSTFTADRGSVLVLASDGNLWLGGMLDEHVLITKISPAGKILKKYDFDLIGAGLDGDYLVDLLEAPDGTLVGCGNFEPDNLGRGFVFRYNPAQQEMVWSQIIQSGINQIHGITELSLGGDYVLYGNPRIAGGDDAELLQIDQNTGLIVPNKAKRYNLGASEDFQSIVFHNNALYSCGRFTKGAGFDANNRMRNTLCKIDTATLQPAWALLSPLPTTTSARLYGRDLIIDNEQIVSTFSGDPTGPDLFSSHVFLQKNDLDGNLVWVREYDLPDWNGEFAEEVISLPDGYMLYGHDLLADFGHLFLLKTDKEGNPVTAVKIAFDENESFPGVPARSKILRLNDALFLTAFSQDNLGQSQGILLKTDLNGWISDSCGFLIHTPVNLVVLPNPVSEAVSPIVSASPATASPAEVTFPLTELFLSKKCGAPGTCPTLLDIELHLDSITCSNGEPFLHFTFCNVGGQTLHNSIFFGFYDKNPLTDSARLFSTYIYTDNNLAPGDCIHDKLGSDLSSMTPFLLDTFPKLYGLIGSNLAQTPPIALSSFPLSPNPPECSYLNNVDSIIRPANLCGDCQSPNTFVKKLGLPGQGELGYSMRLSRDGNLLLAGRQGNNPMIAKMNLQGEPIWVRNFPFNPFEPISIAEIIEDSDGKIIICGTQGSSPSIRKAVVMRYDPVSGTALWFKQYPVNRPDASGIAEKGLGGNFILRSNASQVVSGDLKSRIEFLELDRNTGEVVPTVAIRYAGTTSQRFESMDVDVSTSNKFMYCTGSWKGTGMTQPLFSKVSMASGLPEWTLAIDPDTTASVRPVFSYSDIVHGTGGTTMVGSASINHIDPSQGAYVYLEQHADDGSLRWLKRYDLSLAAEDIVELDNAYVIFGSIPGTSNWGLLKTDKLGNVITAKTFFNAPPLNSTINYSNRQNRLLATGQHLLMMDHERNGGPVDIVLLKTNFDLSIDGDCNLVQSPTVNVVTMPAKATPITFTTEPNLATSVNLSSAFQDDSLPVKILCPQCEELPCTDKPDLVSSFVGLECGGGEINGRFELCNIGKTTFSGPYNIRIYDANPLTDSAVGLLGASLPSIVLAPDSCYVFSIYIPNLAGVPNPGKWYSIIQTSPTIGPATPIPLDSFPYVGLAAECDYLNNVDSFELNFFTAQKPDLGSNRLICPGRSTTLDAGSGFVYYNWLIDTVFTQTITVSATGEYIVETTDQCGQKARDTVLVTVLPSPTRSETILLLPGDSITIGGTVYTGAAVVVDTVPSVTTAGCDTLVTYTLLTCTDTAVTNVVSFYPGDTILIDGTAYTQSDTVVQVFTSATGCDSVVTTILQLIITSIDVQCPADFTVTLPPNSPTTVVDYNPPTATTDCPDPALTFTLLQGLPVGGQFPEGTTQVCYQIANQCGVRDTCCFNITTLPSEMPCDAKSLGCISYTLLDIRLDSIGQKRYRVGVQNNCITPLQYVYIQLPNGLSAVSPAEGATYTAPGGNTYLVRNPNASPFYSLRFKPVTGILNNGGEDIFEYTLPQQAEPFYIHVGVRINDGSYSEVLLNTFNCPVQPYANMLHQQQTVFKKDALTVRPNPTDGLLFVNVKSWLDQQVDIQVLNAQGQLVLNSRYTVENEEIGLHLPTGLANGLYYLCVQPAGGAKTALRFILEH